MGKLFLKLILLTVNNLFIFLLCVFTSSQLCAILVSVFLFFSRCLLPCSIVPFNIPFVNWWKETLSACSCRSSSPFYTSPHSPFSAPIPFEFIFLVKNCKRYFRRHLFSALFGSNSTFSPQYFFLPAWCIQWAMQLSQMYRRNSDSSWNWLCSLYIATSVRSEDIPVSAVTHHFPPAVDFRGQLFVPKLMQNRVTIGPPMNLEDFACFPFSVINVIFLYKCVPSY